MKIRAAVLDRMQRPSPCEQSRPVSVDTADLGEAVATNDRLLAMCCSPA